MRITTRILHQVLDCIFAILNHTPLSRSVSTERGPYGDSSVSCRLHEKHGSVVFSKNAGKDSRSPGNSVRFTAQAKRSEIPPPAPREEIIEIGKQNRGRKHTIIVHPEIVIVNPDVTRDRSTAASTLAPFL